MSKIRILYLGTPDFAVEPLESLAKDEHFEIAAVVSQPDRQRGRNMKVQSSPVKEAALRLGLKVETTDKVNSPEFLEKIRSFRCDSAVVIAFGQILKQDFLDLFPLGVVNVHASLLPRWRGAAPIQRSIEAGDRETGVSLQKIVLKLDAGPVIGVRKMDLTDDIDAGVLYNKMKMMACDLLKVDYMDYLRGNLSPREQNESEVTIAKKIEKEEGQINWNDPARTIFNRLRAFSIWPGVWTQRNGILKITQAECLTDTGGKPGHVIQVDKKFFVVSCGSGALKVLEVHPESKSKMNVEQYLLGYPLQKGEKF